MAFLIPKDGEIFVEQVLERCKSLITSNIWAGLTQFRLDTWMKNFHSETERYFGACILDALIYRSEGQTIALMEQLFQRSLPDLLRRHPPPDPADQTWFESLRTPAWFPSPSPIRIVPVIRNIDSPAKSGPVLARLYRRRLFLEGHWMIWPWLIPNLKRDGIKLFLFIDDFLGTGDQFCDFAKHFNLVESLKGCYAIYAPLVAHESGIIKVKEFVPNLHVVAVEIIDNRYSLFSENSPWFNDGVNSPEAAKAFYHELIERVQFPIQRDDLRGYGKLSLAYAFEHATPDNCLPIIWVESKNWKPLLEH